MFSATQTRHHLSCVATVNSTDIGCSQFCNQLQPNCYYSDLHWIISSFSDLLIQSTLPRAVPPSLSPRSFFLSHVHLCWGRSALHCLFSVISFPGVCLYAAVCVRARMCGTCFFESVASLQSWGQTVYDKSMDWPDVLLLACAGHWQRTGMSLVMHDVVELALAMDAMERKWCTNIRKCCGHSGVWKVEWKQSS